MRRLLMGVETEYALSGRGQDGAVLAHSLIASRMLDRALTRCTSLPDRSGKGVFFGNGGRFYIDCAHPEYATPECSDPWEATRHVRAGERIALDLANQVAPSFGRDAEVSLYRFQVDYRAPQSTWGCHESYLHRCDPAYVSEQLLPHLVSRVVHCGAGGYNPLTEGVEFTLSPRAWLLPRALSGNSTVDRGIFHTKDEPLAQKGWKRLHLLCGESLCSDTSSVLKLGTTALVVALIDAGRRIGEEVRLADPVRALTKIVADPSLRASVGLVGGRKATALEIQRHYLDEVEAGRRLGLLPAWADPLCRLWRSVLDRLEEDTASLSGELDWVTKWALYERRLGERLRAGGTDRTWLAAWARVLDRIRLDLAAKTVEERALDLDRLRPIRGTVLDVVRDLEPELGHPGLAWTDLPFFFRVRGELREIDVRFGQLGPAGIFDQLDRAGRLDHRLVSEAEIARAVERPPRAGRARVRGKYVRKFSNGKRGPPYQCDWMMLEDLENGRRLLFTDPWQERPVWKDVPGLRKATPARRPRRFPFQHEEDVYSLFE